MKGISPLVATVLLIAITMTLAGVIALWGSSFVRTSLPTENQTQTVQACTGGSIKLISSSYNATSQIFSATIYNDGSQKLTITNITFIYPNTAEEKPVGKDISPAQVIVFSVDNVTSGYSSYIVSTNCPNIYIKG
ncbi:MAG: archaellin/type IV pilin N-terminal domain-containing protein [Candidatus Aenigmatarchaeota archaeon]|jgi:flagellin-like protein